MLGVGCWVLDVRLYAGTADFLPIGEIDLFRRNLCDCLADGVSRMPGKSRRKRTHP